MNPLPPAGRGFLLRWIGANAVAELVGLGAVGLAGYALFTAVGEPPGTRETLLIALAFVALGAFEGGVVGIAQASVLRGTLPALRGWIGASVLGAVAAWALGMLPNVVMNLTPPPVTGPAPPEPPLALLLILAAVLGAAAGPLLAAFQWRSLRRVLPVGAWRWLPANAAAWAVGMPILFAGMQFAEGLAPPALVVGAMALSLLAAGAAVGAIHGVVLIALIRRNAPSRQP